MSDTPLTNSRKQRSRLKAMAVSGMRQMGVPLLSMLISVYVVRTASVVTWGAFAYVSVWVVACQHFCGWGGSVLLLKEGSASPAQMGILMRTWLRARLPLLGLCLLLLALVTHGRVPFAAVALWMAASYCQKAFEILVTWRKAFAFALWAEVAGTLVILLPLLFHDDINVASLVHLYALAATLKGLLYLVRFRADLFQAGPAKWSAWGLLRKGFPFFLPGFIGVLNARLDLYAVAAMLDERALGHYHMFNTLLMHCHGVAIFLLAPFLKEFYRAGTVLTAHYQRIALRAALLSAPVLPLGIFGILRFVYGLDLPMRLYLLAGLYVVPFFHYQLQAHLLMRRDRPLDVAGVAVFALLLHATANLILVQPLGLTGAMLAGLCGQYGLWLAYTVALRKK